MLAFIGLQCVLMETNEPDLERAARSVVDENGVWLYHENVGPTENGFWVEAKDLREGDVFLGANGELLTFVSNERVEFPDGITVYNFTVDGNHNYFVIAETDELGQTCVLVHNADPWYKKFFWGGTKPKPPAASGSYEALVGELGMGAANIQNKIRTHEALADRIDDGVDIVQNELAKAAIPGGWQAGLLYDLFEGFGFFDRIFGRSPKP